MEVLPTARSLPAQRWPRTAYRRQGHEQQHEGAWRRAGPSARAAAAEILLPQRRPRPQSRRRGRKQ
jgi:hypothetical protein